MIENIKPVETLTVADFKAHPVWEYLNDDEVGDDGQAGREAAG